MPNMNPRQMQQMMRKMGIKQEDMDAEEVIIKCSDKIVRISNPSVQKVDMMGQKSYQISGEESIESVGSGTDISDEDIETVTKQANSGREEAKQALEKTGGDIAEAILLLTDEKKE